MVRESCHECAVVDAPEETRADTAEGAPCDLPVTPSLPTLDSQHVCRPTGPQFGPGDLVLEAPRLDPTRTSTPRTRPTPTRPVPVGTPSLRYSPPQSVSDIVQDTGRTSSSGSRRHYVVSALRTREGGVSRLSGPSLIVPSRHRRRGPSGSPEPTRRPSDRGVVDSEDTSRVDTPHSDGPQEP